MNRLNEKIAEILRQHPEGEPFFDALDAMIRGDQNILEAFMHFVYSKTEGKRFGVILSGNFGNAIFSAYGLDLYQNFSDVILVSGGLRKGEVPVIFKEKLGATDYIFLDDSFYSGTTRNSIASVLGSLNGRIVQTFVIYDGAKVRQKDVLSMFRYFDKYPIEYPGIDDIVSL